MKKPHREMRFFLWCDKHGALRLSATSLDVVFRKEVVSVCMMAVLIVFFVLLAGLFRAERGQIHPHIVSAGQ
ncbi:MULTISPECIES: hypothetical protein [Pseudomonas syringae group]|uniref:Uncharacterized protein n=6 Tax=Pseudomonas syringae group genomosp. 2 TaxID=251698 RepID=A0AAX1VP57_PSEAJ|nr:MULTISPECIES: hypothetical protein [Pseudomonas syringae group]KPX53327.1 hypothetical protein ALO67_101952 [Pseudomonas amygdali pv. hibisci]KPY80327.1 hypothetical protein ALO60_102015 [Pseudomonas amygdali pv. tabaci]MDU8605475.1 hypothetical protein [Pseudomonas syringae group sp. 247E2]MDU8631637.1 hypothetical protein [Pseudomonas syringae group sp. 243L2]MDU8643889.1 hypothetical protein [Pseudomonas syringae group sp. 26L6]